MHPFDLVSVDVGRGSFHRGRQIEDDLVVRGGPPGVGNRVAYLEREVELGGGKCLWAVFEHPFRLRILLGELFDELDGRYGHGHHLGFAHVEDDFAERLRGGIVNVDDSAASAFERLEGAADKLFASRGKHLDGHVIGNMLFLDQLANEVEIGLRCRWERHLDFLETHFA